MDPFRRCRTISISAEALKLTGVLEDLDLPPWSDEQKDYFSRTKTNVLRTTEDYRCQIRRRFNKQGRQDFVAKERMTAMGLAGGILLGAVLKGWWLAPGPCGGGWARWE
jgi:hypothetical protein